MLRCLSASLLAALLAAWGPTAGAEAAAPPEPSVCKLDHPAAERVNRWYAQGTAAGNAGDFYDNRDRGHSRLRVEQFPQLQVVAYTEAERKRRQDWAAARRVVPHVTIGNSSTSAGPRAGGSNPRQHYVSARGLELLERQYRGNNLYVYPEHRDHDPGRHGRGGYGDLYPTNTPYLIISQGSSGSDRVFLRACALTLAAFQPAVKQRLAKAGLLMPAVQMIFRMSNANVQTPERYLTGTAHPTVFEGKQVDMVAMVERAHALEPDALPPLVQLEVLAEDRAVAGEDHFDLGRSEELCTTPSVIARIHRRRAQTFRLTVSAKPSLDLHGKPLRFAWVVLRGDAERIRIETREDGAVAEIAVPYHHRRPVAEDARMTSRRVDIGVFAHNGAHDSSPAFVTVYSLPNEFRTYARDGRPIAIHHAAGDTTIDASGGPLGRHHPVADWGRLLAWVGEEAEGVAADTLRAQFSEAELAALRRTAAAFGEQQAETAKQEAVLQAETREARDALHAVREAVKIAKKEVAAAEAALGESPAPEAKARFQAAKAARQEVTKKERVARTRQKTLKKRGEDLQRALAAVLQARDPAAGASAQKLVERALRVMRDNVGFYVERADVIAGLCRTRATPRARQDFEAARRRAFHMGPLRKDAAGDLVLDVVVPGDRPAGERLTRGERYELRRLHLAVLRDLLFPACLRWRAAEDYVDTRLAQKKSWREVFEVDEAGALTGWTRYEPDAVHRFTASGDLVVETDEAGRPTRVRRVRHVLALEYKDRKQKHRLAGRVLFDGKGCTIFDSRGRQVMDAAEAGRGVRPNQVQFLVLKLPGAAADAATRPYAIDVNHFDDTGRQTGWTRYQGDDVLEYERATGDQFTARDRDGQVVPDVDVVYEVRPSSSRIELVPRGDPASPAPTPDVP